MEKDNGKVREIKWEVSENDIKRRMDQKFLFIMTMLTIGMSLVFLFVLAKFAAIIVLVCFIFLASFGHYINARMKYNSGISMETYRIDEKGIEVIKSKGSNRELFLWSEISGYHLPDKNLMKFIAYFFDILGRSIIIFINDHRKFSLNVAGRGDYEKAVEELSKRISVR